MRGARLRWFFHCAAVPLVFVVAASPMLILNTIQFRSPFKTGYEFWAPSFSQKHLLFSLRYIPNNVVNLLREFTLEPLEYHTANIFGTGTSFVPTFLLLVCTGLFFIRIDRFVICAFSAGLTFLAVVLSHHDKLVDARYYLPLLILLVAVAVLPVAWAARNILAGRRVLTAAAVFVLFGAACLGYPSHSGYNTREFDRSQAWDAFHFSTSFPQSIQFVAQRQFARQLSRQPGIVLSDIDPVYLNALLPRSFVAAPIDGEHHYKWSLSWRYDRPEALALVDRGLKQSLPIYALFVSPDEMATKQSRLPAIPGYEWHVVNNSPGRATILKLAPVGSNEAALPWD